MSSASWRPDESAAALWNERSYLAGILIGAVAYGVHVTLFFITLRSLWSQKRARPSNRAWIAFIVVLFALSTIANGAQFKFTQMIYIDNRNYPGGPSAYLVEKQTEAPALLCLMAYIVNNWLQDGLIVYRFWVVCARGQRTVFMVFPTLLFVGTIGVSCAFMAKASAVTFFEPLTAHLLTAYFSISVALNAMVTFAIVTKLLFSRHCVSNLTPTLLRDSPHLSVAAMFIESAVLYSACGIAFLVPWGLADPVQNLVLPTLGQAESIAPLLIIMRVAQGRAWSSDTATQFTNSVSIGFRKDVISGGDIERGEQSDTHISQSAVRAREKE